jgi:hypothetical protein
MKYLLCRPAGGINDALNQIYLCHQYCIKHKRCLLIDTVHNNHMFNSSFDEIFTFKNEENIIYNYDKIKDLILNNSFKIYPPILENVLFSYQSNYVAYEKKICYKNVSLFLNFNQEYDEDLIVHHACGGGNDGIHILSLLRINDWLIDIINTRYNLIEKPYESIHIRNTDHKINFKEFVKYIEFNKNIFLATDSIDVLNYFKTMPLKTKLYTFIDCLSPTNQPIHYWSTDQLVIIDTICDLVLLALSDNFIYPKIHFGYTGLALSLFNNKDILKNLINNHSVSE